MNKDQLFDGISILAQQLNGLMQQKYKLKKEETDFLLRTNSKDSNRIQHALDSLLETIEFAD
jgi:regulator of replication initiation timing